MPHTITTEAILLNLRPYGESRVLVTAFSETHGKIRGMTRKPSKKSPSLQPGHLLNLTWKRRLTTQLGTFDVDVLDMPTARCFGDALRLDALQTVLEALDAALADEEPHTNLYKHAHAFISDIAAPHVWERLGFFELQLLLSVGYGLSLKKEEAVPCEKNTPLTYVSPKSGRAVSQYVGTPYANKLLPLPELFGGPKQPRHNDFLDVFKLTGHFLERAVHGKSLPTRGRLLAQGEEMGFNEVVKGL